MSSIADSILSAIGLDPSEAVEKSKKGTQETRRRRRGLAARVEEETTSLTPEQPDTNQPSLEEMTASIMSGYFNEARKATPMEEYEAGTVKRYIKTDDKDLEVPPSRPPFSELTFYDLADRYEGGGSYDTLLANAEQNIFKGIKPSEMTIGELKSFAEEKYNEVSKDLKRRYKLGNPNIPSTPIGRYQFVVTTIGELAEEMGMTDNTPFSPKIQDMMFRYYIKKRLDRSDTMEGKRKELRSAWEGFNKVSDRELDIAIRNVGLL